MESINLTNTLAGLAAIQRAMAGEDILFTKLEIGDGVLTNTDISGMTGLVNKTKEYALGAVQPEDSEIVRLRSNISNAGVTQDLIIREYGIYAKFGNEQEFLFAYLNVGDLTTPLPNQTIGRYELNRDFVLYIGNSTHVDFTSNGHLVYVSINQYKNEMNRKANVVGTIDDLKSSKNYKVGDIIEVLGYYAPGDGGGHSREKTESNYNGEDRIIGKDGSVWKVTGEIKAKFLGADLSYKNFNSFKKLRIIFEGEKVEIDLAPEEIIPEWYGEGEIKVNHIFGHYQFCKPLKNKFGNTFTTLLKKNVASKEYIEIGFVGDSITDGNNCKLKDGTSWSSNVSKNSNPVNSENNLNSTSYNHSGEGGYGSWASTFGRIGTWFFNKEFKIYNISKFSMDTMSGWAYRNLDYGFLQNHAYGTKVPELIVFSMGVNDHPSDFQDCVNRTEEFIKKIMFYGATIVFARPNNTIEDVVLKAQNYLAEKYNIEIFNLFDKFDVMANCEDYTFQDFFLKDNSVIDTIHLQDLAQKFIGAYMFKKCFPERVIEANSRVKIDAAFDPKIGAKEQFLFDKNLRDNSGMDISLGFSLTGFNVKMLIWTDYECIMNSRFKNCPKLDLAFTNALNDKAITQTNQESILYATTEYVDRGYSFEKTVGVLGVGLNLIQIVCVGTEVVNAPLLRFIFDKNMNDRNSESYLLESYNSFYPSTTSTHDVIKFKQTKNITFDNCLTKISDKNEEFRINFYNIKPALQSSVIIGGDIENSIVLYKDRDKLKLGYRFGANIEFFTRMEIPLLDNYEGDLKLRFVKNGDVLTMFYTIGNTQETSISMGIKQNLNYNNLSFAGNAFGVNIPSPLDLGSFYHGNIEYNYVSNHKKREF